MSLAEKFQELARNTEGLMRSIWLGHAYELEQAARDLSIAEAEKK